MNLNIKNVVLILIAVMLASFLLAGLLGATASFRGPVLYNPAVEPFDETREFAADGIQELQVDTISTDINIITTEGNSINVHLYGNVTPDILPADFARTSGNRLIVSARPRSGMNVNSRIDLTLDIYVPSGTVTALRGDTVSGDAHISGPDLQTVIFKTVSGDLRASGLALDRLEFQSVSGTLLAADTTAVEAKLRTTSGDLDISGFAGSIDARTVSGDLIVAYRQFAHDIDFETTSGKTKLTLPEDAQFTLRFDTVSGKVDSEFPIAVTSSSARSFAGAVGEAEHRLQIRSVSGNLNLYQQ